MPDPGAGADPVALLTDSTRELQAGHPVRAVELAAEALATRPDLPGAWCGLGEALAAAGFEEPRFQIVVPGCFCEYGGAKPLGA